MNAGMQLLSVARVNTIMQEFQDIRLIPNELAFLSRTPVVDANENEIMGRFSGYVQIADIIADDGAAVTYDMGKMTFQNFAVPNIKHGTNLTQSQVADVYDLQSRGISRDGKGTLGWDTRITEGLLLGIRERMEALIVGMAIDSFSYDRLGIKMTNVSWGMPADLKVTLTGGATWDSAATATPVSNIRALCKIARIRYGIVYDRMTMSQTAFDFMVSTTEFQTKARMYLAPNVSFVSLNTDDTNAMSSLAQSVLGIKEIELYDSRYWSQDTYGATSSYPYLPINKVVLSAIQNDNKQMVTDFANAVVTESIVGSLAGSNAVGQFNKPMRGPVAYVTVPPDLNPPNITWWAVARGFPRKWMRQATAVLTVGAFVDNIPVGPPY